METSSKRKITTAVKDVLWVVVKFKDDGIISEPIQIQKVEDEETGINGLDAGLEEGDVCLAPYGQIGNLYPGKIILKNDDKQAILKDKLTMEKANEKTKKKATGEKHKTTNPKEKEQQGDAAKATNMKRKPLKEQNINEMDDILMKKKKENNAQKKKVEKVRKEANAKESEDIFKEALNAKQTPCSPGASPTNTSNMSTATSTNVPSSLVTLATVASGPNISCMSRSTNSQSNITPHTPNTTYAMPNITLTPQASLPQFYPSPHIVSPNAPNNSNMSYSQNAPSAHGVYTPNVACMSFSAHSQYVPEANPVPDCSYMSMLHDANMPRTEAETVKSAYAVLNTECASCLMKDKKLSDLKEFCSELERDIQNWKNECTRLQSELEKSNSKQTDDHSHSGKALVDNSGHYYPRRGIRIDKCEYMINNEDGEVPQDYVQLVEGHPVCVPLLWLNNTQATFRNKTKAFSLKMLMNGFFEPSEMIGLTACKLKHTEVGKAIESYAVKKLGMSSNDITNAMNEKIATMQRAYKNFIKQKDGGTNNESQHKILNMPQTNTLPQ